MVLKKPYAFLIKYFKIIHLILSVLLIYSSIKYNKILNFFSTYASKNMHVYETTVKEYISLGIYLSLIIIIIFSALMYLLMRNKKKPNSYYLALGVYSLIIFISVIVAQSTIYNLASVSLDQKLSRAYNDIYFILYLPYFFFIVFSIIRGIGFDVKKFNFKKDLQDLEISSNDNEEFEFLVGTDTYLTKRKIRRTIRELKYYIIENKFIFTIICSTIILVIGISYIANISFVNKTYTSGNTIPGVNYNIIVNKAYITTKDYKTKIIKKEHSYIILDTTVISKSNSQIKYEDLYLIYGDNFSSNYNTSLYDSFSDLGTVYKGEKLEPGKKYNYIFVYDVESKQISKQVKLKIFNKVVYEKDGNSSYKYNTCKLTPVNIDYKINSQNIDYNTPMILGNNVYGKNTVTFVSAEYINTYEYTEKSCNESTCTESGDVVFPQKPENNTLLKINYQISGDKKIFNASNASSKIKQIVNRFASFTYNKGDTEKQVSYSILLVDEKNSNIILEIPSYIKNADDPFITLKTRENKYLLKLK